MNLKENKWGFLRETEKLALKAGVDKDTGIKRTGLEKYLSAIFPSTNDWIHDKQFSKEIKRRPDYKSESLKLIVEYDGLPHYTNPDVIKRDEETTKLYMSLGYKVVRIPYFIQLTNSAVEVLFGVKVEEKLFDINYPSIGIKGKNTPAYLCNAGIERMAKEFKKHPDQYKINVEFLKKQDDDFLTGVSFLEEKFNKL